MSGRRRLLVVRHTTGPLSGIPVDETSELRRRLSYFEALTAAFDALRDVESTAEIIARLAARELASAYWIYLPDPEGRLRLACTSRSDPGKGRLETPADLPARVAKLDRTRKIEVAPAGGKAACLLLPMEVEKEHKKVKRLVIDGLAGFEESVVRPERLSHFFRSVTNELAGKGVTTILTEENRELVGSGIVIPLSGISGVAENIILVRQIEIASELKRAIAVMKTRETSHDQVLRELTITDHGLEVGDPFPAQGGVLTGGSLSAVSPPHLPDERGRGAGP